MRQKRFGCPKSLESEAGKVIRAMRAIDAVRGRSVEVAASKFLSLGDSVASEHLCSSFDHIAQILGHYV